MISKSRCARDLERRLAFERPAPFGDGHDGRFAQVGGDQSKIGQHDFTLEEAPGIQ
jgi:hypothetical protein